MIAIGGRLLSPAEVSAAAAQRSDAVLAAKGPGSLEAAFLVGQIDVLAVVMENTIGRHARTLNTGIAQRSGAYSARALNLVKLFNRQVMGIADREAREQLLARLNNSELDGIPEHLHELAAVNLIDLMVQLQLVLTGVTDEIASWGVTCGIEANRRLCASAWDTTNRFHLASPGRGEHSCEPVPSPHQG